jgi:putative ABC transport system permease protein
MTGKNGIKMKPLEPRVRSIMAREHLFDPTDDQALMVLNTEQLFSIVDNLFRGVNFLIWLVGIGTLLAGAVGVSNIMMVTVRERTVEIGIRRAIGAVPQDILSQIIWESVTLTLAAGSAGIVFSVLILNVVEMISGKPFFQINFWTAILAALLLTVLGVLAGLAPALRAMKIKPVDAMRDE